METLTDREAYLRGSRAAASGNYAKALQFFRLAAEHGYADAQNAIGTFYALGRGVGKDAAAAVHWYTPAAQQGCAAAQYNLALALANGSGTKADLTAAFRWYSLAAEAGHAGAQNNLGLFYLDGSGVDADFARAAELFSASARQGNAQAQCNLGDLYALGKGTEQDFAAAAELYHASAAQGYGKAVSRLGELFECGLGVPINLWTAEAYYRRAKQLGYINTAPYLKRVRDSIKEAEDAYTQGLALLHSEPSQSERAAALLREAADVGHAEAMLQLGRIYYASGDYSRAVPFLRSALTAGQSTAGFLLGTCAEKGLGCEPDAAQALRYYREAARKDLDAQYRLGLMYRDGIGTTANAATAAVWFKRAAAGGHAGAQQALNSL